MWRAAQFLFILTILLLAPAGCRPNGPGEPGAAPEGADSPSPEPGATDVSLPPAPPPPPSAPQGTDYSRPGGFGHVGVDPEGPESDEARAEVRHWEGAGSLLGSSQADQGRWDEIQELDECPDQAVYVYGDSWNRSVAQCQDGRGFAPSCGAAQTLAWARALNVIRSCERVPSCRGRVTDMGQQWQCHSSRTYQGTNPDGSARWGPTTWYKECWIQYKVVCVSL